MSHPTPAISKTPRTDAKSFDASITETDGWGGYEVTITTRVVSDDFARALELENADLLAALEASVVLDEARAVIDAWCDINAPAYPETPDQMRSAMNARDRAENTFRALRAAALTKATATP